MSTTLPTFLAVNLHDLSEFIRYSSLLQKRTRQTWTKLTQLEFWLYTELRSQHSTPGFDPMPHYCLKQQKTGKTIVAITCYTFLNVHCMQTSSILHLRFHFERISNLRVTQYYNSLLRMKCLKMRTQTDRMPLVEHNKRINLLYRKVTFSVRIYPQCHYQMVIHND